MNRTAISIPIIVLCCCLGLSLAACGQRGPLFLPEEAEQTQRPETAAEAQEEDGENSEEDDEETSRT
jgi:predicted small lipoprotein YifL